MKLSRLKKIICLRMVTHFPMPNIMRVLLSKMGGVKVGNHAFIGEGVIFDSLYPEEIVIGNHTHVTMRTIILTHSLDLSRQNISWKKHSVIIGDNVFIGADTIICQGVSIGDNVIVGAGSIVTKNIPQNEVWAGNPAHFIKRRLIKA